jgi:hypothetical protein
MTDWESWQAENNSSLSSAIEDLRLRLELLAKCHESDKHLDSDSTSLNDDCIQPELDVADLPLALAILGQKLGLSRFESDILLLCVGWELDTRVARLCARAQDDPYRPYPTFALALTLFDDPSWDAISPDGPLRYWQLIEINKQAALPLTQCPLSADERILNFIKGLNHLDSRLSPLLVPLEPASEEELAISQRTLARQLLRDLGRDVAGSRFPAVQLLGPDSRSKRLVASLVSEALGLQLFEIPVELLLAQTAELEKLARLWQRESALNPVALYMGYSNGIGAKETSISHIFLVSRFLSLINCPVFLDAREIWNLFDAKTIAFDVARPTSSEQRAMWSKVLGDDLGLSADLLSSQFDLNLPEIQATALSELSAAQCNENELHARLWSACLSRTQPRMDRLAQKIDPRAEWEDLVLPDHEIDQLRQITDQVWNRYKVYEDWGFGRRMNRGLGVSALFVGESGTGKTMAAEVIASDLGIGLYRIDLSMVVSKYIGETEKNLHELFDAAEDGGAILFFDEADALFGKRTEVKDSHDRYANIEINYLLQRMEAYRGLAILATNMKSALDNALIRRLRFIVNFSFPDNRLRKAIWERAFPQKTPTFGLDFERLAEFGLTGGSIHSIALNAAFLAAKKGSAVTMPIVLQAVREDLLKMERPINEANFRWKETRGELE